MARASFFVSSASPQFSLKAFDLFLDVTLIKILTRAHFSVSKVTYEPNQKRVLLECKPRQPAYLDNFERRGEYRFQGCRQRLVFFELRAM